MVTPLAFFSLLILAVAISFALSRLRPRWATLVAAIAALLLALLWIFVHPALPVSSTIRPAPAGTFFPEWSWRVDEAGWWLSLALLLLATSSLALAELEKRKTSSTALDEPATESSTAVLALLLVAAGLAIIWAASLANLLMAWTFLTLAWSAALLTAGGDTAGRDLLRRLGLLWIGLLFLWLAAASRPEVVFLAGLELQGWPILTKSLLLMAGVIQLGAFPFHGWRPRPSELPLATGALIYLVPSSGGALLLARLADGGDFGLGFALPLTLLGFLGLLFAANKAWIYGGQRQQVAGALIMAETSWLLLVGVWAGSSAVIAETRLLFLAGGSLFVWARSAPTASGSLLVRLGPFLAVLAMAGLPFTSGFNSRAALFLGWSDSGRWLLAVVSLLLQIPLIAAAFILVWGEKPQLPIRPLFPTHDVAYALTLLLPAVGLLTLPSTSASSLLVWLVIPLAGAAGIALTFLIGPAQQARSMVRAALHLRIPKQLGRRLQPPSHGAAGRMLDNALRQAAALLEGEGAILWVLLFLVIFWLAR